MPPGEGEGGEVEKVEPRKVPEAKPAKSGKAGAAESSAPRPAKSFDPNQSRTLAGRFADGGRIIPEGEILERVRKSPQNSGREDVDWWQFGQQNGIHGDFREWSVPTSTLHSFVKAGTLQLRPAMTEAAIADKYDSGRRNPVIITRNPMASGGSGNTPVLLAVDGNHSLAASIRKWAVNPREDGYDDAVKCIVSDEAAEWMGWDLQTREPHE